MLIHTSGEDVGLPAGVMGNSEVGHQNIGAGRIVDQEVMRITRSIRDESFFANPVLRGAIEHVKKTGGTLHLLGLMSDGRVSTAISNMPYAFIEIGQAMRALRHDRSPSTRSPTGATRRRPAALNSYVSKLEEVMSQRENSASVVLQA